MSQENKPRQKPLKEIIAEEYLRCSKDPIHFMKKYCIIQHPTKGKVNFHLYPFQEQCLNDFNSHRFIIINKGRQLGLSTLTAGFVLHRMLFNTDFNALVIATKQEVAKNLVTKVRVMHENLPSWLKGQSVEDNKLSLRLSNGSQVKAVAASEDAGRSEALSLLIIDEAAHIEPNLVESIWAASQSTLSTGGGAILISSPNGTGNLFHRKWTEAQHGKQFHPIYLPWYVHPDRNQEWRDKQDDLLGPKMAAQENDCLSGDTQVVIRETASGEIYHITLENLFESLHTPSTTKPNLGKYDIFTPTGFKPFLGLQKVERDSYVEITLDNGIVLQSSVTHRYKSSDRFIPACELEEGSIVESQVGPLTVVSIVQYDTPIELYDPINVEDGAEYYSNEVISHNCNFVTSGHTVIDGPILEWYKESFIQEPLEKRGWSADYWVWEYPDYHRSYIVAADVARGDGTDYSSFIVLDVETVTQVAEFKAQVGTTDFGKILVAVATEWNNALLVIDNNGVGWAAVQVALDSQYPNIFYHYKNDPYTDDIKHLTKGYDFMDKSKMVPGVSINTATRPVMISKLETYFREKTPICKSTRSLDEFYTFIWRNGRAQAQSGYNDDLTMCWAMAFWVRDTALRLRQQGLEVTKAVLGGISTSRSLPGTYITGVKQKNTWDMPTKNNEKEDIRWLL